MKNPVELFKENVEIDPDKKIDDMRKLLELYEDFFIKDISKFLRNVWEQVSYELFLSSKPILTTSG